MCLSARLLGFRGPAAACIKTRRFWARLGRDPERGRRGEAAPCSPVASASGRPRVWGEAFICDLGKTFLRKVLFCSDSAGTLGQLVPAWIPEGVSSSREAFPTIVVT